MLPDRVSNPGPLTYESGAPSALEFVFCFFISCSGLGWLSLWILLFPGIFIHMFKICNQSDICFCIITKTVKPENAKYNPMTATMSMPLEK